MKKHKQRFEHKINYPDPFTPDKPTTQERLEEHQQEGWELVAALMGGHGTNLFFKRPYEEKTQTTI
jgi:hypothetical protein